MNKCRFLSKNEEYRKIYQNGRSIASRYFVVYYLKNEDEKKLPSFGISVSKKIGKAVVRNRLRRRLKEALKRLCFEFLPGYDYVIIPRLSFKNDEFSVILEQLLYIIKLMKRSIDNA
ncbi:ribonuclease P protein component [Carboxydothermus ferrireducens]|uniref:Ribonuclease P protein component n=1 Tax=Carboxydothermus ferrireducens DSM 11255 TaxID=1119529 RepID=A0ABX2RC08_9THEO|nr:ribonuclease P protein component [Carboxydothermus ferrireducens]NYE57598.1 ribonuclease P protein component [Carboxydothermus ferrireducens DSM 11255]